MIETLLKDLKMRGALEAISEIQKTSCNREEFLIRILSEEKKYKKKVSLERRLKQAKFPYVREWCELETKYNPKIPFDKMKVHLNGQFISNNENICFMGSPGTGKTHCAISIAREMCRKGYSVRFFRACELTLRLEESKETHQLTKFLDQLLKPDLLVVDELGFVPFSENAARLLFEVFSKRYETGAMIVTTNLIFSKWVEIFGSIELSSALIDRFTHRCHIYSLEGESVRYTQSLGKRTGER